MFAIAEHADRGARDVAMADWLDEHDARLIVLAGFMELLTPEFVARFRGRMINVHPALLPAFPASGRSSRRSTTAFGSPG